MFQFLVVLIFRQFKEEIPNRLFAGNHNPKFPQAAFLHRLRESPPASNHPGRILGVDELSKSGTDYFRVGAVQTAFQNPPGILVTLCNPTDIPFLGIRIGVVTHRNGGPFSDLGVRIGEHPHQQGCCLLFTAPGEQ